MKIRQLWLKILLFVFALSAGAAGSAVVYKAAIDSTGVQKIEMAGGDYYFKPNDIIVKVNVPVELAVRREGSSAHSMILHAPEAGIDFEVQLSSKERTIRFTPTKTGRYAFYCDEGLLETHRSKGMEGVLEVRE